MMSSNPNLYEINTRVRVRSLRAAGTPATVTSLESDFFDRLRDKGFTYVWLMGLWKNCTSTVTAYCFDAGLVREYKNALPDWREADVIGSPYAIDVYEIHPDLGCIDDLLEVKEALNRRGMRLIVDFVPNHFSAHSTLISTSPAVFLHGSNVDLAADGVTFYQPPGRNAPVLAHGRDPYFPAWQDTVQVNYADPRARMFMIDTLLHLSSLCDGVRCDMAMLALNDVFAGTWGDLLKRTGGTLPEEEFWDRAIRTVKQQRPDFLFIAEAYWDLEWRLQQLGFDYTYDKRLTDRLRHGAVQGIRDHLLADAVYQSKSLRFLENHDEDRAIHAFGLDRVRAAAVIAGTLPGMHLYYDGQFEGRSVRLPVQLGREPHETVNEDLSSFYSILLEILKRQPFRTGRWRLLETRPSWEGDESHKAILAWTWQSGTEMLLVAVNYREETSACRIAFHPGNPELQETGVFEAGEKWPDARRAIPEERGVLAVRRSDEGGVQRSRWPFITSLEPDSDVLLVDLLHDKAYRRTVREISEPGLFIELAGYDSHIFAIETPREIRTETTP